MEVGLQSRRRACLMREEGWFGVLGQIIVLLKLVNHGKSTRR